MDNDFLEGCDVDMTQDVTDDAHVDTVVLTGGSTDMDEVERKLGSYKELFPNEP